MRGITMDHKKIDNKIHTIIQFFLIVIFAALVWYVVLANLAPFGITLVENITSLGTKNRVQKEKQSGQTIFRQINDLVYFSTTVPFEFDTATVRLTFQNSD